VSGSGRARAHARPSLLTSMRLHHTPERMRAGSKPVNERTNSESVRCKLLSPVDASAPASCGVTGGSRACAPKYCDFHGSNVALTSVRFVFYGERNTGTRWFEGLLRGHFPYDMWRPAGGGWVPWKHGCVSFPPVPMRDEPIARHTLQAPPSTPGGVHQVILIKVTVGCAP
jgi:hypothetical protein